MLAGDLVLSVSVFPTQSLRKGEGDVEHKMIKVPSNPGFGSYAVYLWNKGHSLRVPAMSVTRCKSVSDVSNEPRISI